MPFINNSKCKAEDCPPIMIAEIVCSILDDFSNVTISVSDENVDGRSAHIFEVDPPEAKAAINALTEYVEGKMIGKFFEDMLTSDTMEIDKDTLSRMVNDVGHS